MLPIQGCVTESLPHSKQYTPLTWRFSWPYLTTTHARVSVKFHDWSIFTDVLTDITIAQFLNFQILKMKR